MQFYLRGNEMKSCDEYDKEEDGPWLAGESISGEEKLLSLYGTRY